MIPIEHCVIGGLYRVNARNFGLGVYGYNCDFVGIRQKFNDEFLDAEYHADIGSRLGTCAPLELLPDRPPDGVGLSEWVIVEGTHADNHKLFDWLKEMNLKYQES